jgi:hypothetical protein
MAGNSRDVVPRDVVIELRRVGNYMKATAMDPETLTEVMVFGPARGCEEALRRIVVAKLRHVLARKPEPSAQTAEPQAPGCDIRL